MRAPQSPWHKDDGLSDVECEYVWSLAKAAQSLNSTTFRATSERLWKNRRLRRDERPTIAFIYVDQLIQYVLETHLGELPTREQAQAIAMSLVSDWRKLLNFDAQDFADVIIAASGWPIPGRKPNAKSVPTMLAALGILLNAWNLELDAFRPRLSRFIRENRSILIEQRVPHFIETHPLSEPQKRKRELPKLRVNRSR